MGIRYFFFFFQAEGGIRDLVRSRGLGDLYKSQVQEHVQDLQEMAGEYQKAESGSLEQGSGLESGIIV